MQKPQFVENEIYHIYNRGVEKRDIFIEDKDYFRFIHDLFEFNDEDPVLYRRDAETRRIIFGMIDRLLQSYPPLAGVRGWKILSSEPCRKSQFVNLFSINAHLTI